MDKAKTERHKKNTIVQRRMKEVSNAIKLELHAHDVEKKLDSLVTAMEELGVAHDKVSSLITDPNDDTEERWYSNIDCDVNKVIKDARAHVDKGKPKKDEKLSGEQCKLKKIEIPTFNNDHRTYLKWKEQFDR